MLVQSHHSFWTVGDFDPSTGELREFRRSSPEKPPLAETRGAYLDVEGERAVFYRQDASLWLRIGNAVENLDQPGVEVRWKRVGRIGSLHLLDQGGPIAAIEYQSGVGGGAGDPTPFADSEDWDFGLFVKNVLENAGRRARIYGGAAPA